MLSRSREFDVRLGQCQHLMLDLETLSTEPNARILSVGLVEVHGPEAESKYWEVGSLRVEDAIHFHVSQSTVAWWSEQHGGPAFLHRCHVEGESPEVVAKEVAVVLASMVTASNVRLWSQGNFDWPILANFLKVYGYEVPWAYWEVLDLRTLRAVLPDAGSALPPNPHKHHALEDARYQAAVLREILKEL